MLLLKSLTVHNNNNNKREKQKRKPCNNFRYSIFTHKYDTLLIKHPGCHLQNTPIKNNPKRSLKRARDGDLRQPRRTDGESMTGIKGTSGNRLRKRKKINQGHPFVRTQDGFQCEGGRHALAWRLTC